VIDRDAEIDPFRSFLLCGGLVGNPSQSPQPFAQQGTQLIDLVEPAHGDKIDQAHLDAIGGISFEHLLEDAEPLVADILVQQAESTGRHSGGPSIGFATDLTARVVVDKIGLSSPAAVRLAIAALQRQPVRCQQQQSLLVGTVAEQRERIMTVVDQLFQVPSGAVPDRMRPLADVLTPGLGDTAVVELRAAFEAGRVDQGIDAGVGKLIHGDREVAGSQRWGELVQRCGVTAIVVDQDSRFP